MSIFKESFKPNIQAQLKKRQEAINDRTPQNLTYYNSRNSWIRMSSAVDVYKSTAPQNPTIEQLKDAANYDNSLSKKYILQGGTLNENGTLKSGVGSGFENAYSRQSAEGNDYRLGIRPMPGITNIDVKSKGAYGSLREVVVNFQCWDIKQLEDLEKKHSALSFDLQSNTFADGGGVNDYQIYILSDEESPTGKIYEIEDLRFPTLDGAKKYAKIPVVRKKLCAPKKMLI
jgi:hypothetical protein